MAWDRGYRHRAPSTRRPACRTTCICYRAHATIYLLMSTQPPSPCGTETKPRQSRELHLSSVQTWNCGTEGTEIRQKALRPERDIHGMKRVYWICLLTCEKREAHLNSCFGDKKFQFFNLKLFQAACLYLSNSTLADMFYFCTCPLKISYSWQKNK